MANRHLLRIAAGFALVPPIVFVVTPLSRRPGQEPAAAKPAVITLADWPMTGLERDGKDVYARLCIGCHGVEGRGDGEAAVWLNPIPRNFQRGVFKFRSVAGDGLPFEADLMRTVTCGLPGSAMPSFRLVPDVQRRAVVAYVLYLATYGRAKQEVGFMLDDGDSVEDIRKGLGDLYRSLREDMIDGRERLPLPAGVASSAQSIAQGKALYQKSCASCHGTTGRGDGFSSYWLRDWKNAEIIPRDFTGGVFRAGGTSLDLYIRLKTGILGTPMPAISRSDDELWALVHYIESLKREGVIPITRRMGCDAAGGGR